MSHLCCDVGVEIGGLWYLEKLAPEPWKNSELYVHCDTRNIPVNGSLNQTMANIGSYGFSFL